MPCAELKMTWVKIKGRTKYSLLVSKNFKFLYKVFFIPTSVLFIDSDKNAKCIKFPIIQIRVYIDYKLYSTTSIVNARSCALDIL